MNSYKRLMYAINITGHRQPPCGTPHFNGNAFDNDWRNTLTISLFDVPWHKITLKNLLNLSNNNLLLYFKLFVITLKMGSYLFYKQSIAILTSLFVTLWSTLDLVLQHFNLILLFISFTKNIFYHYKIDYKGFYIYF